MTINLQLYFVVFLVWINYDTKVCSENDDNCIQITGLPTNITVD